MLGDPDQNDAGNDRTGRRRGLLWRLVCYVSLGALLTLIATALSGPWWLYWHGLEYVDGRPALLTQTQSVADINAHWATHEPHLRQEQFGRLTPYWIYWFLTCDLLSCAVDRNGGMSHMAGVVAQAYMADGHFRGRGQGEWHQAAFSLTIWVQRNLSVSDVVSLYLAVKPSRIPSQPGQ